MSFKPGNGKKVTAPCGHPGEVIIGTLAQCYQGCWTNAEEYPTIEVCLPCGSENIDLEYELDEAYYQWNPSAPRYNRRCWTCGRCWSA